VNTTKIRRALAVSTFVLCATRFLEAPMANAQTINAQIPGPGKADAGYLRGWIDLRSSAPVMSWRARAPVKVTQVCESRLQCQFGQSGRTWRFAHRGVRRVRPEGNWPRVACSATDWPGRSFLMPQNLIARAIDGRTIYKLSGSPPPPGRRLS
jgi:hypothetical protein